MKTYLPMSVFIDQLTQSLAEVWTTAQKRVRDQIANIDLLIGQVWNILK